MAIVGYKFYGRNIRPYLYAEEKKPSTILGMTLFSLVIFGAFAIRPSIVTISRLRQEVKKAGEAKIFLDQKIGDLSRAQINYQLALKDLKLVEEALPKDEAVPQLLETLALAAGKNNVVLNETRFGPAPFCDGKRCGVHLTVTVTGELGSVENFISELENGVRQMDVKKVKMNRSGEELEQMTTEVELVTFFFEEEAE